jgi:hypothetical protein
MDFTSALCKGQLDLFFSDDPADTDTAKGICRQCELCDECLTMALQNGEAWGVWGGTDYRERTALAALHGYPIPERFDTIEHGTPRGYAQHEAQDIPLDDYCGCIEAYRSAARERMRKYRANKKRKDQEVHRKLPGPFTGDQTQL